jgi:chromosome partitioning protein
VTMMNAVQTTQPDGAQLAAVPQPSAALTADRAIAADAEMLSAQLQAMRNRLFPPTAQKALRKFTSGEAAKLIGVSDGYLRQLSIAGEGPQPETGASSR